MKTSKPQINKPKVPAKIAQSVIPKAASKSHERARAQELRRHEERYERERSNHGLDERRKLTEIEHASKVAHERTLRERACREKRERCGEDRPERRLEQVGQAGARKERPMYSIDVE